MGTHPIFESDFDCLTDLNRKWIRGAGRKEPETRFEIWEVLLPTKLPKMFVDTLYTDDHRYHKLTQRITWSHLVDSRSQSTRRHRCVIRWQHRRSIRFVAHRCVVRA